MALTAARSAHSSRSDRKAKCARSVITESDYGVCHLGCAVVRSADYLQLATTVRYWERLSISASSGSRAVSFRRHVGALAQASISCLADRRLLAPHQMASVEHAANQL
jgi:hypothetical protein